MLRTSFSPHASLLIWLVLFSILLPTSFIIYTQQTILLEWNLFSIISTPIYLTVLLDPIGITFSCVVLFISANVLRFSSIYMAHDKFKNRFTVLVILFIISINLLIYLPNFIVILLGWDGLGIVSFILVIYYQNPKSLAAGLITALTNRIGDVILLLSIAWTLNQGHWSILNIWNNKYIALIIFCIIIAGITKRAQIPFSRWLPAAMAAPTPVSALVHSSTLVTAGVFLLIRFYPFLHQWPYFNTILLTVAVTTMLIAGLSAVVECDIKKIIALSTLRQLGIIITRIGLNIPNLAYFHILTHALFKALLFICAGSFINNHHHSQDLRWIGNLTHQIPIACSCITLANLALCGFPFLAGFYSKDIIIEARLNNPHNLFIVTLAILRLGLTSFYSLRFSIVVMWGPKGGAPFSNIIEHEAVTTPILNLSIISICAGSLLSWLPPISSTIFLVPSYIKIIPLIIVRLGLLIRSLIYTSYSVSQCMLLKNDFHHYAVTSIWFLVPMSTQFLLKWPTNTAHAYLKALDHGWTESSSGIKINESLILINNTISTNSSKSAPGFLLTISTATVPIARTIVFIISC